MSDAQTKQQVRQFYDKIGWQEVAEGLYQNAQYEDLRQVSAAYIHRCHMRVNRYLVNSGRFLLDAGSGPIQYPEYLTYSEGFHYRVCVDISIVALQEARKRIGEDGLFVVADVANLPFKNDCMDAIVSLHTLHHLSIPDQEKSFHEFHRLLKPGVSGVIVNGWKSASLMNVFFPLIKVIEKFFLRKTGKLQKTKDPSCGNDPMKPQMPASGTYVQKLSARNLRSMLAGFDIEIRCWRSVSVRFLRALIHPLLLGRFWLWLLYRFEELFPRFFGENGQYPLVILTKSSPTKVP